MVSSSLKSIILLARHGNTFEADQPPKFIGSKGDPSLTSVGRDQARKIGNVLREINFVPDLVLTGPRKRQQETASIICSSFRDISKIEPIENQLFEELDYGVWEGLTQQEIIAKWADEFEKWQKNDQWPEKIFGSSKSSLIEKIDKWFKNLVSHENQNKKIVVVTSNGILRLIYQLLDVKRIEHLSKVKTGYLSGISITIDDKVIPLFWNKEPDINLKRYLIED